MKTFSSILFWQGLITISFGVFVFFYWPDSWKQPEKISASLGVVGNATSPYKNSEKDLESGNEARVSVPAQHNKATTGIEEVGSNPTEKQPFDSTSWQILTEQNLSSGLSLGETATFLLAKSRDLDFFHSQVEAPSAGTLRYVKDDFAFVISDEGEDRMFSLYYYFRPESIILLDGVERTTIGYSFHLSENGYSLFVEAKSKSDNPNIWRGISYSNYESPMCTKFFPPGSDRPEEMYPVLGMNELSQEALKAWKEKMEALVAQVK